MLRAALLASVSLSLVNACSPSDGAPPQHESGGTSPGGAAGNDQAGSNTGGSAPAGTGGSSAGTPSGGSAGTATGGSAGAAAGGASGAASGAAGAPAGGTSGAAGDAGATNGGTAGAAGSGGDPGAYTGTIIVQDDFDTGSSDMLPDPMKWEPAMVGDANVPALDGAKFRSPPNSARVQSTNHGRGSFLVPNMNVLPVTGNSFYVRVFMNWEKATSAISGHSGFIVGSAARDNSGAEARLGISSKGPGQVPRLDFNLIGATDGMGGEVTRYSNGYTDGGNPADFTGTGFQFEAERWYCVEAYFGGAMNAAEFRVWIDGAELAEMHVTDFRANTQDGTPRVNWAPTYNFLKIGAQDYDANLGQIWYDDVFVGTAPVGCER